MRFCWRVFALRRFALAAPAVAQDGAQVDDEVVVTARRTEESLQEVPAAVSAFSEQQMERIGATDATGLQGAVPNLNIVQGRGSSNATNIYIRGVGQPDALQTFDPAVGFYVDGVYYSRIRGTQMELFDIERVEVLRGPQGTLYGKNTIGGAYSVITRRPGQDPRGLFQVTVGDYGELGARIAASGPINENLAIGGALFGTSRDGYVTNPITGEDYNDRNAWGGRFAAALGCVAELQLGLLGGLPRRRQRADHGPSAQHADRLPARDAALRHSEPHAGMQLAQRRRRQACRTHRRWITGARRYAPAGSSAPTSRCVRSRRTAILPTPTMSISTPRRSRLGDVLVDVDQDQISQEFQAIWRNRSLDHDRRRLFHARKHRLAPRSLRRRSARTAVPGCALSGVRSTMSWKPPATPHSSTRPIDITDRLSVSGGLRYTEEEKDYFRTTSTFSSNPALTANPALVRDRQPRWDERLGPHLARLSATDEILLYARVSQGFKSGGFNGRANDRRRR